MILDSEPLTLPATLNNTIIALETDLTRKERELGEIRSAMDVDEDVDVALVASEMAAASNVSSSALEALRNEVASRDDDLTRLTQELDEMRGANLKFDSQISSLRKQLNALAVANSSMYNDMKTMENRLDVQTAEADQLRLTLEDVRTQLQADGITLPFEI